MKPSRTAITLAGVLAFGVGASACGAGGGATSEAGTTSITWAQPTPESMGYYPYIVADELGYFAEEGLEVELAPASEDLSTATLVANGNADIGAAGAGEILHATVAQADVKVVYSAFTKSPEGIVVPAASDVQAVAGLEGKQVGLASDEEQARLAAALGSAGLSLDDVETVIVGTSGPTLANEMKNGTIAAFGGSLLDFAAMQGAGVQLRDITPDNVADIPGAGFAVSPATLEENPEAIEGFLRAFAKATHVGIAKPDLVESIVRERVPEEWQNEQVAQALFDAGVELFQPREDLYGELDPQIWQETQQQLLDVGELEQPVDFSGLLTNELVEAANDWDRETVVSEASQ